MKHDIIWRQVRPQHSFSLYKNITPTRHYATYRTGLSRKWRRAFYIIGGSFTVGGAGLLLSDDVRFMLDAVQRSSRVLVTLGLCINDYRTTLKHQNDGPEEYHRLLKECHQRCATKTFNVMEKSGSIFLKLGQHLSSLHYLLPAEWCDTFIPLQDRCPVSPFEDIQAMVQKDTGRSLTEWFSEFNPLPIGAASLAQVHVARLRDSGEQVAVKLQHPSLAKYAPMDLALTRFSFRALKRWFPEYDLTWLSSEMEVSLPKELDFEQEGKNAEEARLYFSKHPELPVIVPKVFWAKRRILVMEYVSGKRPDNLEYLDSRGIDRDEVSAVLARVFNEMIFGRGAPLHCDPHAGNLAIRANNRYLTRYNFDIILYDHGLYRHPPLNLQRDYAKLWLAVLDADEAAMRKYSKAIAGISDEDFPIFASAITGRDYSVVKSSIAAPRSSEEQQAITDAIGDGLIEQIIGMLGKVPRLILLILKTNDLTRSLDENLHTRQGPIRSFLILARYAARTVYEEQLDNLRGSLLSPVNLYSFVGAWSDYTRIRFKLGIYEFWLSLKGMVGIRTSV